MPNRYMKRCLTALIIMEMHVKITIITSHMLEWLSPQKEGITNVSEDVYSPHLRIQQAYFWVYNQRTCVQWMNE